MQAGRRCCNPAERHQRPTVGERVPSINLGMRATLAPLLLALSSVMTGCYPEQISSLTEAVTVTTLVDSQAPLKTARTFALPDTVLHPAIAQGADVIGHEHDAEILTSIRSNFVAMGWREVRDVAVEHPDVVVLTFVLEQTNTGVAYTGWWGGWSYWPGWPVGYGSDWFWGYPGNVTTFTYETGTLAMVMLDIRNGDQSAKRVPILWAGAVNGALAIASIPDVLAGIDQAFIQSPYLERK